MSKEAQVLRGALAPNDRRVAMIDNALALGDPQYVADTVAAVERTLPRSGKLTALVTERLRANVANPSQVVVLDAIPGENAYPSMRSHIPRASVAWTAEPVARGAVRITWPMDGGIGPAQGLAMWWNDMGARSHALALADARKGLDTGDVLTIEVKP